MKKTLTILCSILLCIVTLTGCNLVELDKSKYYNQVVASVNSDNKAYVREYTKKDLSDAIIYYSYESMSNGSMTQKQGVDNAFNKMIENGLLTDAIKTEYIDKGLIKYSAEDEKQIRNQAFDTMQKEIFKFEDEIREEKGLTNEDDLNLTEDEVEESLRAKYNEYEPNIIFDYETNSAVRNEDVVNKVELGYDVPEHFVQKITDEEISSEAYVRYVKTLQSVAKAEGRDSSEAKVIAHEEERLIKLAREDKYRELFNEYLQNNALYNYDEDKNTYFVKTSVTDRVLEYYKNQYRDQKNKYDVNISAYRTAMTEDASKVYYHPNSGEEFMYVSHILLKFSDTQKKQVDLLKSKLKNGQISQTSYDTQLKNIANNIQVVYEKNGQTQNANALSVYKTVVDYVNTYGGNDPQRRAQKFNDMIYMFNDDEGIMNKDFAYVVNLKTEENGEEIKDNMVKEFADASRNLNTDPTKGVGSLSDMVISEYGVHIIFHAGLVENIIQPNNIENLTYEALFNHTTQLSSNKTLFNFVCDSLTFTNYNQRTTDLINQIKGIVVVNDYKSAYKDLYK